MYAFRKKTTYYPNFRKNEFYLCKLGSTKKTRKTVYMDNVPYYMDNDTGEIIRKKKRTEIALSMESSIRRTINTIKDIAMSNQWSFFVTLTFNPSEVNRYSEEETYKLYKKWQRSMRYNYPSMRYICVREHHKSGALHFHLLIGGITESELNLIDSGKTRKLYEKDRVVLEQPIYNINSWSFGFSTAIKIVGKNSQEKVCNYIIKYIGKEFGTAECFKKKYWFSKNSCHISEKKYEDIPIDIEPTKECINKREFINKRLDGYLYIEENFDFDLSTIFQYGDFSNNHFIIIDYDLTRKEKPFVNFISDFTRKFIKLFRKNKICVW